MKSWAEIEWDKQLIKNKVWKSTLRLPNEPALAHLARVTAKYNKEWQAFQRSEEKKAIKRFRGAGPFI